MSIFFVSAIVVFLMSMFLCLTEDIALSKILFESVSMFATVGLPTGTINEMDASSRIVIIFVMLMGRIGIISLAIVETGAIYCFVVTMILIFSNPFWNVRDGSVVFSA